MIEIRKIVLDVLKPHNPGITPLAKRLANINGIEGVNISVYEMDKEVENVKITIEGRLLETKRIREVISDAGGSIHSTDEVVVGKKMVEEGETLQERHQERK